MRQEKINKDYTIAFIDTEIDPYSHLILDMGGIKNDGSKFHDSSMSEFIEFLKGSQFVCGHNILNHDIKFIGKALNRTTIISSGIIDTLYLSPLLFPSKPYHALLKDDKLQSEDTNNPLNDAIKAKVLFDDEVTAFYEISEDLKAIFHYLLHNKEEFQGFFRYISFQSSVTDVETLIRDKFRDTICEHVDLNKIINDNPIELAYALSLIHSFIKEKKIDSITPPWVLKNFPNVERIFFLLRNKPCLTGCTYCDSSLNAHRGLKRFFGFDSYRSFDGEALQEEAVNAAIHNKSLLAVFPTGGGKSIAFQVPALIAGENSKALTVIISPLQSLMKDQVDNLEQKGITEAVTINGLLDPIERAKSFERVEDGSASILYIAPESLRSKSIERLILGRKIARFVIDEAHCFSAWGHDFRVDYLYIGDFIRNIQTKKNLDYGIPVSCFTATAKQQVIQDIQSYFKEKLSLDLELFTSKSGRTNLNYRVISKEGEEEKYQAVRDLISGKDCPTIIYVSRTRRAYKLAERLTEDGFSAKPYHGKMESQEKIANQDAFISGKVQVIVATSAFGMGVDKKDVGMVIHYDISDSLENYVQEAGRAGRDENITADCYVLFNEEDLSKHFILLNQTKLSIKEIQQVWRAIKEITRFRSTVSNSALEIARKAGWDDSVVEIETRVTTAIAALEDAGYLKRGQNIPRIFANSILTKNAMEAINKINNSERFDSKQKENAIRIIKKLYSSRNRKHNDGDGETRVDYISDQLGIVKAEVINSINLMREEKILADNKDLTAFIKKDETKRRSLNILISFNRIENFLLPYIEQEEKVLHLKELNEEAEKANITDITNNKTRIIFNFWAIKKWIKRKRLDSNNHIAILGLHPNKQLQEKMEKRHQLAEFIIDFLYERTEEDSLTDKSKQGEMLVGFSVHELKTAYENSALLFKYTVDIEDIEECLFYLSRIEAIKIEGGFLVVYNSITIERTEQDNLKRYTKEDYQKLNQFYQGKIQQIHIVGEYANRMLENYKEALQFVEDYFHLNYSSFLSKYFKGSRRDEIKQNITPTKFKQLFGVLSPAQLNIVKDSESKHIVVAAGPGSGKTRVLVHKLASLLLMEDVKHEQLLMLTFSRAAATEFKQRLIQLIGNAAYYIEIKTFHSYCFDLLGRVGNLEKSEDIVKRAVEKIKNYEVEPNRITKTVLVIDEAQDMDADEFNLVSALMEQNEEMRVIAVGDDDQNIYEFRGSDSKYFEQFIRFENSVKYELIDNFRSKNNLVEFSNQFVKQISKRFKQTPIFAIQNDNGRLKIIRYQYKNLMVPLVQSLCRTELSGSTCVMTRTNQEALQITGLLLQNNMPAKLIQSNEGLSLYNLAEVRFFFDALDLRDDVHTISDEKWVNAKRSIYNTYRRSQNLELFITMIKTFESTLIKNRYKSDLEVFVRESNLEDFYQQSGDTIFVSTMHKTKGKEFDNVFLMLENFNLTSDASKRLVYVAMTRAKKNLYIHLNEDYFDNLRVSPMEYLFDKNRHEPAFTLSMNLTHRDVWLSYFYNNQAHVSNLMSGDKLFVDDSECVDKSGNSIVKFSQSFVKIVEHYRKYNYIIKSAKVNFVVYWKNEDSDTEVQIVLPEILFERKLIK